MRPGVTLSTMLESVIIEYQTLWSKPNLGSQVLRPHQPIIEDASANPFPAGISKAPLK